MKKLLSIILILSLVLFAVSSCGTDVPDNNENGGNENGTNEGGNTDTHVHEYNRKKPAKAFVNTVATCTKAGVYYYSCACGACGTETFTDTALSPCKYENGSCVWCGAVEPSETDGLVYSSIKNGEAFMVTGYNGTAVEVYIPSYHEGKPVLRITGYAFRENTAITSVIVGDNVFAIDNNAFADCTNLERVVIGSGVETIGECAFGWCASLKSVNLPDSLTTIEKSAFWMCSGLTEIRIPYGVTAIGEEAFGRCDGLTEINVPDSVESIARKAFYWCIKLEKINVDADNAKYTSKDGVLYNKDMTTVIQYPTGSKNTDFAIPETVTTIGYYAFSCSENLKNLTIPNSVNKVEYYAFGEVSGFNYNNKGGLLYLGNESNPYLYLAGVESKSIESATVASGCKFVGDYAFSFCTHLTGVSFEENSQLISIGNNAFFYCGALESVVIPASAKLLNSPFYACTSLKSVTFDDGANWYVTENHDTYCNPVDGVLVDTSNSATNATCFAETYSGQCWYKK